jgi:CcmD family protein
VKTKIHCLIYATYLAPVKPFFPQSILVCNKTNNFAKTLGTPMKKYILAVAFSMLLPLAVPAQDTLQPAKQDKIKITTQDYANQKVEMADSFRADGKIYVVLAVILLILGGLFAYLFLLDKKITALEKIANEK